MKNSSFVSRYVQLSFVLLSIIFFTSCRSHKDLSYLTDAKSNMAGVPRENAEYKIQLNDNLYVSIVSSNLEMNDIYNPATVGNVRQINNVWQNLQGQFVQGYMVEPEGLVTLPLIGKVNVAGKTIREAEALIQQRAQEYLKEVTAKVRVLNYKVTVLGEVKSPGVYFNYNYEFTVMDALSSASGVTNSGDLRNVLVLRQTPEGSKSFKLDLNSRSGLASEGYFLLPNDVVVIQPSKYKNVELRLPLYTAALSTVTTFLLVLNYISNNN